jgi:hypothetical protein
VPDLKDELRQLADDAARQARPLAVADVIREGDRRHRRTIIARRRGGPRSPGLAPLARPGRRRPGWVAPLAAAAAVTAVIAVVATVPGAIDGSGSAGHPRAASAVSTVYVTIFGPPAGRDGLIPISTATSKPGKPIRIRGMSGVAITPDGRTIYAGTGDTVIPISTATSKPGRPIHFHAGVSAIAVNPDGDTVYVEAGPRVLVPVRTATNTPGRPIRVRSKGGVIAFTPDGKTAYVGGPGTVTPINTVTNTPGKPIRVGSGATIAITPDGKTLYAATMNKVVPVSTATNTPGKPIPLRGPIHGIGILIAPSPATSG